MKLTPQVVQDIHKKGGTILVSDRGELWELVVWGRLSLVMSKKNTFELVF